MVKYWTKLLNTENCILKGCYDDMLEYSCSKPNDKQNWCCKIKEILFKYRLNYVWLNQCVDNVENLLLKLKEKSMGSFISEVTAFFQNSPKCEFYKHMYSMHTLQYYLDRPVNYIYKPFICEYRMCAHNLSIETGRFYNINRNERFCFNFILECSRYNDLRRKYIKHYYWRNPSAYKLVTLLSVRNVKELNNFGKYLCLAEKLRNA